MRAALPLEKAIIFDIVDENNRGKWTFSAALGGYLIDKYNFQVVFLLQQVYVRLLSYN